MDPITVRYGESLTLPIDTGDASATSASIYIGKPGAIFIISKTISLVIGEGVFVFASVDTRIPLGTYYYQINVTDALGYVEKYPTSNIDCDGYEEVESDFPKFIVREALDETEVS